MRTIHLATKYNSKFYSYVHARIARTRNIIMMIIQKKALSPYNNVPDAQWREKVS